MAELPLLALLADLALLAELERSQFLVALVLVLARKLGL